MQINGEEVERMVSDALRIIREAYPAQMFVLIHVIPPAPVEGRRMPYLTVTSNIDQESTREVINIANATVLYTDGQVKTDPVESLTKEVDEAIKDIFNHKNPNKTDGLSN